MTKPLRPPALDPQTVPARTGSIYPEPFRKLVAGREKRALGDALGLGDFGVNLVTLPPGAMSALRHWHSHEDEFVYVLEGAPTLVTEAGEQSLGPGMAAGFPKGAADGHHLINRTGEPVLYLEVGTRHPADEAEYPDVDLSLKRKRVFVRKTGEPY
jgi:uncharacterized cupin superfamily protein